MRFIYTIAILIAVSASGQDLSRYRMYSEYGSNMNFIVGDTTIAGTNNGGAAVVTFNGESRTNWPRTDDSSFQAWLATNDYVRAETDPVFTNWLATNIVASGGSQTPFTNDVDMAGYSLTNGLVLGVSTAFVDQVVLNEINDGATLAGTLYRDTNSLTFSYVTGYGCTLQGGEEIVTPVVNKEGYTITNGMLVAYYPLPGDRIGARLAKIDDPDRNSIIGFATHNITNEMPGLVTSFGRVHDVSSSIMPFGVDVHLYASTNYGGVTINYAAEGQIAPLEVGRIVNDWGTHRDVDARVLHAESDPWFKAVSNAWYTLITNALTAELDPSFASVSNLWYGILTNVQSTAVTGAVTSVNGIDGDVVIAGATNSGQTIYISSSGGIAEIPLNGASALDWGVLNGTMGRITSNGYSTLYGDYDTFRYTDSLPVYSLSGGTITTNYIGLWRDANATVRIIQQVSGDNGSTWDAVTNDIAATTNATVFGVGSISLNAGANLYRVAIETNATSGTIYIYQIDARGQL